jgi:Helicase conserved C-terminal domain
MSTVKLPETLVAGPDLEALARSVREGTVRLDWTDVRIAPTEALVQLLAGCNMVSDADSLGLGSLSDDLSQPVFDVLLGTISTPPETPTGPNGKGTRERRTRYDPPTRIGQGTREPGDDGKTDDQVLTPPTPWELRSELQDLVLRDLLGPAAGPEEEVDEPRVLNRYLVGMLAPGRQAMHDDADDALASGTDEGAEDGAPDPDTVGPSTMFPSSFGLSFAVDPGATAVRVTARWGRYERTHSVYTTTETGAPKTVWKRIPVEGTIERLVLREAPIAPFAPSPDYPDVTLRGRMRRTTEGWLVTLFLVNDQHETARQKDTSWLFQAELSVEDADGESSFLHRPYRQMADGVVDDEVRHEEEEMAMVYRHLVEFAAGHGVGIHADLRDGVTDRAFRLTTRVVPEHDVPITEQPTVEELPVLAEVELDMKTLAALDRAATQIALKPLLHAYRAWIEDQGKRVADPTARLQPFAETAGRALAACTRALERIELGLELLERDEIAFEAFRFANQAMWQQRIRTMVAERVRRGVKTSVEEIDLPENRSWRLFQLAFILLNLPGITELDHPERDTGPEATADLLWFPTGGGKTEAYLGLTAYTLGMRRLQGDIGGYDGQHGVAVLMRYTLRLLTLQQFQRAAALLCACERIRSEAWYNGDTRWGSEPFRIGLWVGNKTTPNRIDDANEAIKRDHGSGGFRARAGGGSGTPAQLTNCPWCGQRIDPGTNIKVDLTGSGRGRVLTFCGDPMGVCPFTEKQSPDEGLPVMVVDEEIYRYLPALLISTVDKFAQMPWRGETQMLFGKVNGRCERHGFRSPDIDDNDSHPPRGALGRARTVPARPIRPPDLIIQDELHLISGPLGTLVGTYETAIDELATWEVNGKRIRPKVIASTATVRRAPEQMRGLFLRKVELFPPQGLDIDNNFFARQRRSSPDHPGRRYIGICAPGRRLKAALIRVYVAHLAAAQLLYKRHGAAADPWMTLVGYFNSMRELGGMRRVVDDDVRSRLRRTDEHGLAIRRSHHVEELTSRKSSTDIPEVLDLLEQRFDPAIEDEQAEKRKRGIRGMPTPIDVLLATNMLSVGVDVQRLGLMVVAGQPKTTAEYIQATSRVGRRFPGLICTVYNWTRPRDLSHYERFEHYHATFYQQVEALSVTPFSPRARDRSLSALLVTLIRLEGSALNANGKAGQVQRDDPMVERAIDTIVERAWQVSKREDVRDQVRCELNERLDDWLAQAENVTGGSQLSYKKIDGVSVGLLQAPSTEAWTPFTCLTSLRDVEPEVGLILDDYGMDNEPPHSRERLAPVGVGVDGTEEEPE